MNRKDYRKMMQRKKMNKLYSKSLILGLLGLGVTISGNTIVKAEAREWKANTSTTIKKGDTEYKVLWGDTLSLISRDSGITIETLTKLNNILDANLIFEGNIIVFGNGATATVKDESGNVIAETPLTEADKAGIKEAQQNNTNSTNSTTVSNVNTSNGSSNVSSNTTNSSSVNSNSGNNTSNIPTNPTKPEKPTEEGNGSETGGNGSETGGNGSENGGNGSENGGNGSETEKPEITEFDKKVFYQDEDGETVYSYFTKVKVEGISTEDNMKIEYGFIDTTEKLPEGYKLVNEKDSKVKVFNTTMNTVIEVKKIKAETPETPEPPVAKEVTATVNYLEDGNIIHTTTEKVKLGEDGFGTVNAVAPTGYEIVGDTSATVSETNTNVVFTVKKQAPYVPVHTEEYVTVNVDEAGNVLSSTVGYEKVSESTDAGVTTTQPNGDTHTVYTTTVVWKKAEVTPPTAEKPTFVVAGEKFGGRKPALSEFVNPANQVTSNGYVFPDETSANNYGWANMNHYEDNQYAQHGFFTSSITMKDGSTKWVVEWNYIIDDWE